MSWIPSPFKSAAIGATVLFSEQLAPNCLWMNSSFGATPDFGGSWAAKVAASAMAMKNNTRIALLYARLLSAPIEDEVPEECVSTWNAQDGRKCSHPSGSNPLFPRVSLR